MYISHKSWLCEGTMHNEFPIRAVAKLSEEERQVLQAPKVTVSRGSGGMPPQKSLKSRISEMLFLAFFMNISQKKKKREKWETSWSSNIVAFF